MVLANIVWIDTFAGAYDFLKRKKWEFVKQGFDKEVLKGCKGEDRILNFVENLNSLGWSDEEIINYYLKREKKTYFVIYNEGRDNFDIYEVNPIRKHK